MTRRIVRPILLLAGMLLVSGHVGSRNVFLDGNAGPYGVRVVVRPPEVIPGQAEISVRSTDPAVRSVGVRPVVWSLGLAGAPPADEARPVEGEPGLWSAQLWLMDFGSYSVHVAVRGAKGEGTLVVPVPAVATRVKEIPPGLATGLIALGIFLVLGLFTIVGAAVREAVLPPGEAPAPARVRRSWIARAIAVPVIALLVFAGGRWWGAEDSAYGRNLYRPPEVTSATTAGPDGRILTLRVNGWDSPWGSRWSPLLPDHGKLMHLFLMRQPGLDAFAHLHPERVDSSTFRISLPPLPGGEYRLYADILHESGFQQTLTDTVAISVGIPGASASSLDPDDSWTELAAANGASTRLADGSTMTWERERAPLRVDRETTLRFLVLDPAGRPADLEPYMGMPGHAAITRDDGSVFVHLHPMGTVSMAALQRFEQITRGDTARDASGALILRQPAAPHDSHVASGGTVEFPYAFPREGMYRIWVQVRRGGRVLTGVFDTVVSA